MATTLFTNIDLSGDPLGALANVYHSQAFDLTVAQDKLIDLLTFVLVDHANGPGWTKPYTGTNKAVFQPSAGNQHYFRVDETDGSYYADVRMFESMTDVDTGSNESPSGGTSRWYKGGSSGSSNNDWFIICDERAFYFGMKPTDYASADEMFLVSFWGDFVPYDVSSAYLTGLYSSSTTSSTIYAAANTPLTGVPVASPSGNMRILRGYNNSGTGIDFRHAPRFAGVTNVNVYLTGAADAPGTPNPASGQIDLAKADVFENTSGATRVAVAEIPGLYVPRHEYRDTYLVPNFLNLLVGSGDFSGKSFLCVKSGSAGGVDVNPGPLVITLDNWRS